MPELAPKRAPIGCLCGSGLPYAACCGELHHGRRSGGATAPTAERLMRSRFSAFALSDAAYLLATWHPSTRPASLELSGELVWERLEILGVTGGGEDDDAGTVEFVAHYREAASHQPGEQREHSAFVREAGQWFYVGPVQQR